MKIKNGIPVIIYKNNVKLKEFPSIQQAARFMKKELEREFIPWAIINKGIHQNEQYTHTNGVVYSFNQTNNKAQNFNTDKVSIIEKE